MTTDGAPTVRRVDELSFPSGAVHLPALLHRAAPDGDRDLVLCVLGNPGGPIERDSPLADVLTPHGIDVLQFNYRGTWGNAGAFNVTHSLADLRAAIDFATGPDAEERFGLGHARIHVLGYSYGTAIGLLGAMDDDRIAGVVSLAACDHGYFGSAYLEPGSEVGAFVAESVAQLFGDAGPIPQDPAIFLDDLVANRERHAFVPRAAALLDRRLLFVTALDDAICPPEDHFLPLYRALRRLGHPRLEADVLMTDHGLTGLRAGIYARVAAWVVAGRGSAGSEAAAGAQRAEPAPPPPADG